MARKKAKTQEQEEKAKWDNNGETNLLIKLFERGVASISKAQDSPWLRKNILLPFFPAFANNTRPFYYHYRRIAQERLQDITNSGARKKGKVLKLSCEFILLT